MSSLLEARDLSFLDWAPMSFSLEAGECVGLSGESGSGKSLLLRALADLDPHGGEVLLDGVEQAAIPAPEWRSQVGYLAAESRWWFDSVRPHFVEVDEKLLEALGFEPGDVLDWEVRRLSAGERQRLALARLLVRKPALLLLDEPTANLDPRATAMVEAVVAQHRDGGVPVLWVGHDAEQLSRVAGRRLVIASKHLEEVR